MDSGSDFTLICATASTVTATPWRVYRSFSGATSNDISSSESNRWLSTIGKITTPRPFTILVPRKPYTTSASCGPAFRYRLANIAIRKMTVKTINVAITITFIEISIIRLLGNFPILFLTTHRVGGGFQFLPSPHVRDAVLIPCHYYFHAARNGIAILTARRGGTPRPFLRKQDLAGATRPDGAADCSQHSDHLVVRGIQMFLAAHQDLGEKPKNNRATDQPADQGNRQGGSEPRLVIVRGQISGAAEPGQKRRSGTNVEGRNITLPVGMSSVSMRPVAMAAMAMASAVNMSA